jgi:hypothetical protein
VVKTKGHLLRGAYDGGVSSREADGRLSSALPLQSAPSALAAELGRCGSTSLPSMGIARSVRLGAL